MKKDLLMKAIMLLFVLTGAQATWAQDKVQCLAVAYADGEEIDYFALDASPVITYGSGTINVKQDGEDAYSIEDISLDLIEKYYFEEGIPTENVSPEFSCDIDPKDGSTLSELSQVKFSNAEGIVWNEDEENGYEGDPIYVTDESGAVVATLAQLYSEWDEDDIEVVQIAILGDEDGTPISLTEVGQYKVVVPAAFFYCLSGGKKAYCEEMNLSYTIAEYPFDVTPADGAEVDEISEIIVACDKGMEWNVSDNQENYFQVTDEEGTVVYAGVWDAKVSEEEGNTILSYSLPLYDDEADGNVPITLSEVGDYKFTIPAGMFYLGDEKVLSPETTIRFSIKENSGTGTGIGGISAGGALMTGLEEGAHVYVYTADGQTVVSAVAGKDGKVGVDLNSLKSGQVYILRTPNASYKIVK